VRHAAGPIFAAGAHQDSTSTLALLLSLTNDFPVEWTAFVNGKDDPAIPIGPNLFPHLAQGRRAATDGLVAFAPGGDGKLSHIHSTSLMRLRMGSAASRGL